MPMKKENIFQNIPASLRSEFVQRLAGMKGVRIERIVSRGHSSPTGYWYDQAETEWVMLVKGAARIRFEADDSVVEMTAGDHITIAPRARHRVEWTKPDEETIWLAVFY
jgi:cupin 2 domain-containing protein